MITITIASEKAQLTIMSKRSEDLLGDAAALVASYQDLTNGKPE